MTGPSERAVERLRTADFDHAAIHIPDPDREGFGFDCPNCDTEVRPPDTGSIWSCHVIHGGCGATYLPVEAFIRLNPGGKTEGDGDGEGGADE